MTLLLDTQGESQRICIVSRPQKQPLRFKTEGQGFREDDLFYAFRFQNDYGALSPTSSELNTVTHPLTPWALETEEDGVRRLPLAGASISRSRGSGTTPVEAPQALHGITWGHDSFLESLACFSGVQGREKSEVPPGSFSATHL